LPSRTYLEGVEVPIEAMNVELNLYVPPEANTFTMSDNARIVAENMTSEPIAFAKDYGIHLYQEINGSWVPIENRLGYPEGDIVLLPKDQEFLGGRQIVLLPDVREAEPTTIRIVVVGQTQNRSVAGFVDITLNP
jgi:hypothetical protein